MQNECKRTVGYYLSALYAHPTQDMMLTSETALVISRFACLGALTVLCVSGNSSVTELVMRLRGSSCALYSRNGSASLPPSAALTLSAALSAALTCPLLSS
jgi:hypothetical protein